MVDRASALTCRVQGATPKRTGFNMISQATLEGNQTTTQVVVHELMVRWLLQ
jgi:hypothetical protein